MSRQDLGKMWLQLLAVAKVMSENIRANDEYGDSTEACDEAEKLFRKIDKALKDAAK